MMYIYDHETNDDKDKINIGKIILVSSNHDDYIFEKKKN